MATSASQRQRGSSVYCIQYFKGKLMQGQICTSTGSVPRRPTLMDPATSDHEPHAGKASGSQGAVQHTASLSTTGYTRCRRHSVRFASWQVASACLKILIRHVKNVDCIPVTQPTTSAAGGAQLRVQRASCNSNAVHALLSPNTSSLHQCVVLGLQVIDNLAENPSAVQVLAL